MCNEDCRKYPVNRPRFPLAVLIVVLMMLPMTAHGELVCNGQASWTFSGPNTINVNENGRQSQHEFAPKSDLQHTGYGFGVVYWFVRAPVLGVGGDYFSSKLGCVDTTVDFFAFCPYLLIRLQFGRSSRFPHGRIVPYAGIGLAGLGLSGELGPTYDSPSGIELRLGTQPFGLAAKFGLEWIIGGRWVSLGVFIEGRYLKAALGMDREDSWTTYDDGCSLLPTVESSRTQAEVTISFWQLTLGTSLHLGVR